MSLNKGPREQVSKKDLPINEQIRFPKVQLIMADGQNIGVVSREEALRHAREAGLDLVILTEKGGLGVPVTKIVDYGKVLYEKKKKLSEAKKHQKVIQIKEIKIRPKIGEHDLRTKIKKAIEFLQEGKHLKLTVTFRGREVVTRDERGKELFDKIEQIIREQGSGELIIDKETKAGPLWFRLYMLK